MQMKHLARMESWKFDVLRSKVPDQVDGFDLLIDGVASPLLGSPSKCFSACQLATVRHVSLLVNTEGLGSRELAMTDHTDKW